MAKLSSVQNNLRKQRLVAKYADRRARLKAAASDQSLSAEERFKARLQLAEMPRNGSKIRIRNRCQISGRPRAYYRKFGISRIALREMASSGLIPGVVKSSW